ncbi:MAG TPA: hypothetical protein VFP29_00245 [Methyloceanibacter sp.]|jgi:hypothetical protein|nr:hypothetical protein [Methyloceanibacter sp.]
MKFVSIIVAAALITVFGASAFAGETKAECERAGKVWDSKTNTCYSANGY